MTWGLTGAEQLLAQRGESWTSKWIEVDQTLIDGFADLTRDWNFIHVDPEKAAKTELGGTIAHGFLLLSLLAQMRAESGRPTVEGLEVGLNYGFERVRFISPVRAGRRIRGRFEVTSMEEKAPGRFLEAMAVTVEIEGEDRPAIAADWLTFYVF